MVIVLFVFINYLFLHVKDIWKLEKQCLPDERQIHTLFLLMFIYNIFGTLKFLKSFSYFCID